MKRIETRSHLATRHLFDVMVDTKRLCFEAVEEDEHGNKILHKSRTISMSSAMGEESEYYLLTEEEYQQYRNRCGGGGSGKSKSKKKKKR